MISIIVRIRKSLNILYSLLQPSGYFFISSTKIFKLLIYKVLQLKKHNKMKDFYN